MSDGIEKLREDLVILEQMASEMPDYLRSDVLFWRMEKGNMPALTLGGYLMRQYRLLALRSLLAEEEQGRLRNALDQFDAAIENWMVRVEQRAHQEIDARMRQWSEYLRDLSNASSAQRLQRASNYASAVEARDMLEHLVDHLYQPGYELNPRVGVELNVLDRRLKQRCEEGEFVWPEAWEPGYPKDRFWYLYCH